MTFDLENARAADEVLPYPLDAKEIWVSGKGQMHINPPNAPSIFFTLSDLCEFRNIFHGQAAEIERLRASLIDLHAEYINTLEKNPECSAWDLDEQSDADQKRLRRNAAHAISIVEPPIYLQAEQRATKIKELEDVHKRSGAKYAKIINELRSSVYANIPGLKKQWDEILNAPANGKIGPEDAKPRSPQESDDLKHCHSCGKSIDEVKGNLCKGDYFIGSIFLDPGQEASRFDPPIDASYYLSCCDCARSWQITEERKAALGVILARIEYDQSLPGRFNYTVSRAKDTLRAMLEEAQP